MTVKEKITKRYLVATPLPRPIKIESGNNTQGELLSKALLTRVEGRSQPILDKHKDEDFLMGICSVYGLVYATQILNQLRACNQVQVQIQTVDEEIE
jgi:hypothetical protein